MPKAYSYLRFSTAEQAKGDSYRRQTQQAEQYAAEHGLEFDDTLKYHDLGVSAFRGANATIGRLGEFIQAIETGRVERGSLLLVESLDRLSRDCAFDAQNLLSQIIGSGIIIVTLADRKEYSIDILRKEPYRIVELVIILIRANEESETKSRRLKAAWHNKREKIGEKILTTIAPAWLELDKETGKFKVIPDRANTVRWIYSEHIDGRGPHLIAQDLRAGKEPTWGKGKRKAAIWHKSYVTKILQNPAVIGKLIPHKMDYSNGKKREPIGEIEDYYPRRDRRRNL